MSQLNAVTLHPKAIVEWLRNEADGHGEDGNIDTQNMLHKMADDIDQLYDTAIYGEYQPSESAQHKMHPTPSGRGGSAGKRVRKSKVGLPA